MYGKIMKEHKKMTNTRAGVVAQVIEHLPSKSKTLSSNPSTTQKKKNKLRSYKGQDTELY
jgi:hypothetical protein